MLFPTPVDPSKGGGTSRSGARINECPSLHGMARKGLWPTPQAHDCHKGDSKRVGRYGTKHGGRNLNDEVAMWPTPSASSYGTNQGGASGRTGKVRPSLETMARQGMWPTPAAGNRKGTGGGHPGLGGGTGNKRKLVAMGMEAMGTGQLNPDWVEYLMGWPVGWSSSSPLPDSAWADWLLAATTGTLWLTEPPHVPRVSPVRHERKLRLTAIGNGQVPLTFVLAWQLLHSLSGG